MPGLAEVLLAAACWAAAAGDEPCRGLALVDVATEAGLLFEHRRGGRGEKHLPETMGAGLAWLDYDGDGWLDLYAVQSGPFPPDGSAAAANRLFRNRGDGSFEDVTATAGAGDRGYGQGAVALDVNGDGFSDLYVTNFGADALWLNQGDGSFRRAPEGSGVALDGWSSAAAFADLDGDGRLDLYVTRYVEYDPGEALRCTEPGGEERTYCDPSLFVGAADRLFLQGEDGRFRDHTLGAGLGGANGRGLGVVWVDLDADHRPDLYVANDLTLNFLYRNRGDGTFEDHTLLSGAAVNRAGQPEASMGVAVGDVDGDGLPELAVTNFDVETNSLYKNLGGMQFEDVAAASGFGPPSFNLLGFGMVFADLDLDSALDAFVANGHIFERPRREGVRFAQPPLLLLGDGRGSFRQASCGPAGPLRVGRGVAAGDFDNDGDLDLAVSNNGGPLQLLENQLAPQPWLGVRLIGKSPNTEAVGAEVTLRQPWGRQHRWVIAGDSYQSSSDRRLLFGLGRDDGRGRETSSSPLLEVRWPDGSRRRYRSLPGGKFYTAFAGDAGG